MPSKPSLVRLAALLGVALLLVSAGCLSGGSVSHMTAKKIGQQADQKYSQLTSYNGTVTITSTMDGKTTSSPARHPPICGRPEPARFRARWACSPRQS